MVPSSTVQFPSGTRSRCGVGVVLLGWVRKRARLPRVYPLRFLGLWHLFNVISRVYGLATKLLRLCAAHSRVHMTQVWRDGFLSMHRDH